LDKILIEEVLKEPFNSLGLGAIDLTIANTPQLKAWTDKKAKSLAQQN
jgi:hypothetical protein